MLNAEIGHDHATDCRTMPRDKGRVRRLIVVGHAAGTTGGILQMRRNGGFHDLTPQPAASGVLPPWEIRRQPSANYPLRLPDRPAEPASRRDLPGDCWTAGWAHRGAH